jgi:2-desacetyl-2-hydroxyethyl bacteriochlorophyllide A dehydrogenase
MKAFVFAEPGTGVVREKELKAPGIGEVRLNVAMCGVCGTDMRIWRDMEPAAHNISLGHEFAGEVDQLGPGVSGNKIGDRVVVDPNIYCHACEYCLNGEINLCENLKALGVDIDGGFARFCNVPVTQIQRIPDNMSFEKAALVEPLACALNGIERADIKPGQSVMIIGAGPIGLIMLRLAKLRGASPVLLSESVESRRGMGLKFGADQVYDPSIAPLCDQIALKDRPKVVIECVGHPSSQAESIQLVKRGGTVVLFGDGNDKESFSIGSFDFYYKNLTVRGAALNPYTQNRALNMLAAEQLDADALITKVISLDELPALLDAGYGPNDIKVLVNPNL